jgi:hypothetical protein
MDAGHTEDGDNRGNTTIHNSMDLGSTGVKERRTRWFGTYGKGMQIHLHGLEHMERAL